MMCKKKQLSKITSEPVALAMAVDVVRQPVPGGRVRG